MKGTRRCWRGASTLIDRGGDALASGRAAPPRPRFCPAFGAGAEAARPVRGARSTPRPRVARVGAAAGAGASSAPRRGFRRGDAAGERAARERPRAGRASAALVRPRSDGSNACTGSSAASSESSESSGRWRFAFLSFTFCVEDGDNGAALGAGDAAGAGDVLSRDGARDGAAARERRGAAGTTRRGAAVA